MNVGRFARVANAILGLWLFVSALIWPHTRAERVNVALVGLFLAQTSLSALTTGPRLRLRFVSAALAIWLLVSLIAFPPLHVATAINSAVVGTLVLVLALVPTPATLPRLRRASRAAHGVG